MTENNRNHIKSDVIPGVARARNEAASRSDDMALLLGIHGSVGTPELRRSPGFNLNKNKGCTSTRHNVDLGIRTRLVVPRYYRISATPQIAVRQVLASTTQGGFRRQRPSLTDLPRPIA